MLPFRHGPRDPAVREQWASGAAQEHWYGRINDTHAHTYDNLDATWLGMATAKRSRAVGPCANCGRRQSSRHLREISKNSSTPVSRAKRPLETPHYAYISPPSTSPTTMEQHPAKTSCSFSDRLKYTPYTVLPTTRSPFNATRLDVPIRSQHKTLSKT